MQLGEAANSSVRRVFLCHTSEDKLAVRALYQRLQWDGFLPWLDEEDLLPGQQWQSEIARAVRSSAVVLVCLSPRAIAKTGFIQREIRHALDVADEQPEGEIFLIPIKLEECAVPERLRQWHWVSLAEPQGYERLIEVLTRKGLCETALIVKLRLTVHVAAFVSTGQPCYFINATNLTGGEIELTHVWFETYPEIQIVRKERPLPKRLKPQETWETWVDIASAPSSMHDRAYTLARVRLSTGEVMKSVRNFGVPPWGIVPGGPVRPEQAFSPTGNVIEPEYPVAQEVRSWTSESSAASDIGPNAITPPEELPASHKDSEAQESLKHLAGAWVSRDSNSHFYAAMVGSNLIAPYCWAGDHGLTGVYFSWRRNGEYLFARFAWVNGGPSGFTFLQQESIDTLVGAWWSNKVHPVSPKAPPEGAGVPSTWERVRDAEFPEWATRFLEDVELNGLSYAFNR
jgi:hypothetical protein